MLANAMRGLGNGIRDHRSERGIRKLDELMTLVDADEVIPKQAKQAITGPVARPLQRSGVKGSRPSKPRSLCMPGTMDTACRLATIPGYRSDHRVADRGDGGGYPPDVQKRRGNSPPGSAWCRGRNSTGGKTRLGRITKTGNREITGSCWCWAPRRWSIGHDGWNSAVGGWLQHTPGAPPRPAGARWRWPIQMARIAWAVMTRKESLPSEGRCRGRSASGRVTLPLWMAGGGRKFA